MVCDTTFPSYLPTFITMMFVSEQWLATAATNGAVVLWNIQKSIKLKQETVYNDHKRTVNKVQTCIAFYSVDSYLRLCQMLGDFPWIRTKHVAVWVSGWYELLYIHRY